MTRRQRLLAPAVTVGGLAAATLALHLRDPHQAGSWGVCPSALLGLWCPGCGGLRAVNDLTHGRLVDAASSNLLLVVAAPFAVLALLLWTRDRWHGRERQPPRSALPASYAVLGVVAVFTLLRNLPAGSWLAP